MIATMHPAASRRGFLRTGALAMAGAWNVPRACAATAIDLAGRLFSAIGIAASLGRATALKTQGAEFLTESVGAFLVPDQADEVFAGNLAKLAASPLKILACNGFIRPAHLRCVGKEANHEVSTNSPRPP